MIGGRDRRPLFRRSKERKLKILGLIFGDRIEWNVDNSSFGIASLRPSFDEDEVIGREDLSRGLANGIEMNSEVEPMISCRCRIGMIGGTMELEVYAEVVLQGKWGDSTGG